MERDDGGDACRICCRGGLEDLPTVDVRVTTWLVDHRYQIPADAEPLLRPYVEAGTKFFIAKVDPTKVTRSAPSGSASWKKLPG